MRTEEHSEYDVLVIGGGFAGVTAARDVRRAGRRVLLLEARNRLGGRTWYRPFAESEQSVEMGGTWVVSRWQPHVGAELEHYESPVTQSPAGRSFRWVVGGERLEGGWVVPPDQTIDFERGLFHVLAAARRIEFGRALDRQPLADLDVSFADFLAPLALPSATREYLYSWAGFFFGADPSEVSALHVLSWVAGFGGSAFAWYAAITDKLAKGTGSLIEAMLTESEPAVRLSAPVRRVEQTIEGVTATTRSGECFSAATAIIAVPLNVWHDLEFSPELSERKRTAAKEGQTGHSVKVWALTENVPPGVVSVGWGGGLNWLSHEYALREGSLLVGFGTSPVELDVNDRADVQRAVEHLLPGARVIRSDAHDWNADEFSQGTWMAYRPGQVMRFQSAFQEAEGRIAFAGSDLALGWAGWIDGAIESGARAAQQVLELMRTPTAA